MPRISFHFLFVLFFVLYGLLSGVTIATEISVPNEKEAFLDPFFPLRMLLLLLLLYVHLEIVQSNDSRRRRSSLKELRRTFVRHLQKKL
jgi:hypothetical protein